MNAKPFEWVVFSVLVLSGVAGCATTPAASKPDTRTVSGHQTGAREHKKAPADNRNAHGFAAWVRAFRQHEQQRGISRKTLSEAFGKAEFKPHIVELDHRQPEFTQTIWQYLDAAVSQGRIADGRAQLAKHRRAARSAQHQYGVSRFVITAIWGVESDYGQNFGHYETIDALATLGYDGRREKFAKRQLHAALKILADGDIDRERMRGSWAGAMGHTQFLPTSFLQYAVDADDNGKRNIWSSIADVMASTANYLADNGWQTGSPWGREVRLPGGFDYAKANGRLRQSTRAWRAAGVRAIDGRGLPRFASATLIAPTGAHGPAFLVGPNFAVIKRYNNATSYALAVGLLADRIAGRPGVQQAWPRDLTTLSKDDVRELQADLNTLGYGSGTPDGIVGPNTRSGVRAFQSAHGMTADGYPTVSLLRKIRRIAARAE